MSANLLKTCLFLLICSVTYKKKGRNQRNQRGEKVGGLLDSQEKSLLVSEIQKSGVRREVAELLVKYIDIFSFDCVYIYLIC